MADHKNQHFVPRVLLRPFTNCNEGKSINLYNIRADRMIQDAALKGQCARHYWYGEDGQLETILSKLEGMFGSARGRIITRNSTAEDRELIGRFMFLQHWRTLKAAARLRHSREQLDASSWAPNKKPIPDDKTLVIRSMYYGLKSIHMFADLKLRIVENRTETDFVISDDPSVMLNRFAYERLNGAAFGVGSAGLIFVMPLSARLSLLCYDGQVYSLQLKEGRSILNREDAVDAYNDVQLLNAAENVYFHRWEDRDYVRKRFFGIKDKREPLSEAKTFVPDGGNRFSESYRIGTVDEGRKAKRSMISVKFNYPEPDRWIPGLRYRDKPKYFYNGNGWGYMRKPEWLNRK